ncbi:MAG: TIGR03905 family TSCPD domain-containing protein [bacterium]|nr:TIGR03905 family TSCPD domain-containing protein [bacterium]
MKNHVYMPKGVCSSMMKFDIENGILHNVEITGGCPGNTKAICRLLEGADAKKTVSTLKGTLCREKGTSCADQLATGIELALSKENI